MMDTHTHKYTYIHPKEVKEKFLQLKEQGVSSYGISRELGLPYATCKRWKYIVEAFGKEYFLSDAKRRGTMRYDGQTKEAAVRDLLAGDSISEVMKRYKVRSVTALTNWEREYTKKNGFKKNTKKRNYAKYKLFVELYKAGLSQADIAKRLNIAESTVAKMKCDFESLNEYELLNPSPFKNYSEKLKEEVIRAVLSGKRSVSEAGKHYGVPCATIRYWVRDEDGWRDVKAHRRCYADRFKETVVQDVISGNLNCAEASRKYGVPRTTLWKWVKKYKEAENLL